MDSGDRGVDSGDRGGIMVIAVDLGAVCFFGVEGMEGRAGQ